MVVKCTARNQPNQPNHPKSKLLWKHCTGELYTWKRKSRSLFWSCGPSMRVVSQYALACFYPLLKIGLPCSNLARHVSSPATGCFCAPVPKACYVASWVPESQVLGSFQDFWIQGCSSKCLCQSKLAKWGWGLGGNTGWTIYNWWRAGTCSPSWWNRPVSMGASWSTLPLDTVVVHLAFEWFKANRLRHCINRLPTLELWKEQPHFLQSTGEVAAPCDSLFPSRPRWNH